MNRGAPPVRLAGPLLALSIAGCGGGATGPEVAVPFLTLNDTGVTRCYGLGSSGEDCPIRDFPGQDAEFGRDARAADDSDGRAGFSFLRLDERGRSPVDPQGPWACVLDRVTGLVWAVQSPVFDGRWRYSWFDGAIGVPGGGTCPDPGRCDTQGLLQQLNAAAHCGRTDWRLPQREELRSLFDYGRMVDLRRGEVLDPAYFPRFDAGVPLWTATRYAGDPDTLAWSADGQGRFAPRGMAQGLAVIPVSDGGGT